MVDGNLLKEVWRREKKSTSMFGLLWRIQTTTQSRAGGDHPELVLLYYYYYLVKHQDEKAEWVIMDAFLLNYLGL